MHPGALPFHSYPINTGIIPEIIPETVVLYPCIIPMFFNVAEANGEVERVNIH